MQLNTKKKMPVVEMNFRNCNCYSSRQIDGTQQNFPIKCHLLKRTKKPHSFTYGVKHTLLGVLRASARGTYAAGVAVPVQ